MDWGQNNKDELGVVGKVKEFSYGVFYQLKRNDSFSQGMFKLMLLVMTCQLLYFPISLQPSVPDSAKGMFRAISGFTVNPSAQIVMVIASVVAYGLAIAGTVIIGSKKKKKTSEATMSLVGVVCRLNQTAFQIPMLAIFSRLGTGDIEITGNEEGKLALSILGFSLALSHLLFTSVFAIVTVQELPFEQGGKIIRSGSYTLAASSGRVEGLATLVRGLIAIGFEMFESSEVPKNITLAYLILFLGMLTIIYGYFLPFYNQRLNHYAASAYGLVTWICISSIAANATKKADHSGVLLMMVPTPFVIISIWALILQHALRLKGHANGAGMGIYLQETRLRLRHFSRRVLEGNDPVEFKGEMEEEYREFLSSCPVTRSAFPHLLMASLATRAGNRVIFALNLITQVRKNQLPFDLDFYLYCHNQRNTENQQDSGNGAISYIALDRHLHEAKNSLIQTLKYTASFWRKVSHGSCTLSELLSQGAKVHQEASQCRFHLGKLRKLSQTNKQTLKLQSLFFFYVMNDRETAINIELEIQKNSGSSTNDTGFAVCTISGDPSSLGRVLDASQALCELFGYSKSDLVGHNVNVLCPPPFDAMHDQFLKQFVSMDSEFTTQTRRIWGLHAKGHILLVDFEVTPSTNAQSELILIGRFSKVQQSESTHMLICDARTQAVTALSEQAPSALGLDESDIFAMTLKVSDILPDFFTGDKYVTERSVSINNKPFSVKARFVAFENKPDSPVTFSVTIYVVTLTLQQERIAFSASVGLPANIEDGSDIGSDLEDGSCGSRANMEDFSDEDDDKFDSTKILVKNEATTLEDNGSGSEPSLSSGGSKNILVAPEQQRLPKFDDVGDTFKQKPSEPSVTRKTMKFRTRRISGNGSVKSGKSGKSAKSWRRRANRQFDTGSYASSATGVTAKDMEISSIQRKVLGKLSKKDPELITFGVFAKRFILVLFVVISVELFFLFQMYGEFYADSVLIENAHKSADLIIAISLGVLYYNGLSDTTSVDIREYLDHSLDILRDKHASVVIAESPDVDIHKASMLIENRNVSYHVSVLEYIANVENYLQEDNMECKASCEYIVENSINIFEVTLEIVHSFLTNGFEGMAMLETFELVMVIIIGAFMCFSFFYGFLPMFLTSEGRRVQVGKSFLAIPADVCKNLQVRTEKRLFQIQMNTSEGVMNESLDLAGSADDMNGDEEFQGGEGNGGNIIPPLIDRDGAQSFGTVMRENSSSKFVMNGAQQSAQPVANGKSQKSMKMVGLGESAETSTLKVKPKPAKKGGAKVRPLVKAFSFGSTRSVNPDEGTTSRKDASSNTRKLKAEPLRTRLFSFLRSTLQVSLTFWVVFAYFGLTMYTFRAEHAELKGKQSALYIAGKRFVMFDALQYYLLRNNTEKIDLVLKEIRIDDAILKYGDESFNIEPLDETTGGIFDLNFNNACDEECLNYIAINVNNSYGVENLNHGLVLALERYLDKVENGNYEDFSYLKPHHILASQMEKAMEKYHQAVEEAMSKLKQNQITALIGLLFGLSIARLISLNALNRMDRDLKKNQTLLLMLPSEVFQNVPEMANLLRSG